MRDRLADRDVRARQQRHFLAELLEDDLARPILHGQADVNLRRFDTLHMFVELRAAGSPGRRRHLGHAQQQPFQAIAKRVGVRQARAGDRHRTDGQGAFVELRKERSTSGHNTDQRRDQQRRRRGQHRAPVREGVAEPALIPGLEPPGQARFVFRRRSGASSEGATSTEPA